MCGIAGIFNFNAQEVNLTELKPMCDAIKHRGPDGEGFWVAQDKSLGFGHRRLSIIDLSDSGKQPMLFKEDRYCITYNGEIYNYLELKEELISAGIQFQTESDTEVLLAAYHHYGKNCLQKLDGMFAFAIWDELKQELFCARDRLGEKPFFYYIDNQKLVFASEIKAILAHLTHLKIDSNKIQAFLNDGLQNSHQQSFFEKIHVLPQASFMLLNKRGENKTEKYWKLAKDLIEAKTSNYVVKFKEDLITSIKRRMRMDVNYGSSLSGGIDSSTISSIISKVLNINLLTFSARFPGSKMDESKWIDIASEDEHITNISVCPDANELLKQLNKISYYFEYPLAGTSMFAQWKVMELVQENGIKVLIDGQGADEYLCGYDDFRYFAIWDLFYQFKFKRFWQEKKHFEANSLKNQKIGWGFIFYPFLKFIGLPPKEWRFGCNLKERMIFSVEQQLSNLLLSADRNAMAHSVEVRLPFTSHELIEFIFSLPVEYIFKDGQTKTILRNSMKGIVDQRILDRTDKIGFAAPQDDWLESSEVQELLQTSKKMLLGLGYSLNKASNWRIIACASLVQSFKH